LEFLVFFADFLKLRPINFNLYVSGKAIELTVCQEQIEGLNFA